MTAIAYTIGRTSNYDKSLADSAASGEPAKKMGRYDDYEGGWIWASQKEAARFIEGELAVLVPEWDPGDFSVYELKLPHGWGEDVTAEPSEDGVRRLLHDAVVLRKVWSRPPDGQNPNRGKGDRDE